MPSEFPMNDPRNIWQDQPTEPFKISADKLRRKAQKSEKKARFEAIYSIIIGLILFVFFAAACARGGDVVPRLGFGLLSLWSLYFAYYAYKRIWPRRPAPDSTLNTTLQSYRSRLEKRRDYVRHIWRRSGLPFCFLGLALIVAPELIKSIAAPRLLLNVAPVLTLFAIWLVMFLFMRKRNREKLQREIEELRVFEREN